MSTSPVLTAPHEPLAAAIARRAARVDALATLGVAVLRYGLALLLLLWGGAKFTPFEAEAIRPLVEHSPLIGWLYTLFGVRGGSAALGAVEIPLALLITARPLVPRVSGYASLTAASMFCVTLSFLATTPGVLAPTSPWGGFLMKDVVLLGAALVTAADAFRAARPSPGHTQ